MEAECEKKTEHSKPERCTEHREIKFLREIDSEEEKERKLRYVLREGILR
jgi:hypothetical protein